LHFRLCGLDARKQIIELGVGLLHHLLNTAALDTVRKRGTSNSHTELIRRHLYIHWSFRPNSCEQLLCFHRQSVHVARLTSIHCHGLQSLLGLHDKRLLASGCLTIDRHGDHYVSLLLTWLTHMWRLHNELGHTSYHLWHACDLRDARVLNLQGCEVARLQHALNVLVGGTFDLGLLRLASFGNTCGRLCSIEILI